MPMVDKPENWCRPGMSDLWDRLKTYVDFVELFGVNPPDECEPEFLPSNDDVEDASCVIMCGIIYRAPVARCIIPVSASAFEEVDCS